MAWPEIRKDLKLFEGYHSPQLAVEVRLNTNESPLPPPSQWVSEIQKVVATIEWNRYPDRDANELASQLAQSHGVQPNNVVSANGSNEIIQSILLAYGGNNRSSIIYEPTYAMHAQIAKITGTEIISCDRDGSLLCGHSGLETLRTTKPNIVFLCSPNNPTGLIEPKETIISALEYCSQNGSLLVVDEAYGEFSDWSAIELVDNDAPIVVTRTFSKAHGFAAGRLGYAVGATRVIDGMKEVLLPYHLDSFKQIAGLTALKYKSEMAQ
ncbi:histidinol-phosphate transaminase [bacterium]|nr:histidinol-phosphate transaminase [bacterium]